MAREPAPASAAAGLALRKRLRAQAEAEATALRDREDRTAAAPFTIAALRRAGVSGRAWLARARDETQAPLICLPLDGAEQAAAA